MLRIVSISLAGILLYEFRFRIPRIMHGKRPVIQKEWFIFIFLDESDSFFCHPVLYMFTRPALSIPELPRGKIPALGAFCRRMGKVAVETLMERIVRFFAEMPFAR